MKTYDYIIIGTGSGLALADAILQENDKVKIAVIDKDPGWDMPYPGLHPFENTAVSCRTSAIV